MWDECDLNQSVNDTHFETNVITFLTCGTNVILNQSINDTHLETNVITFLMCGTNLITNQSINGIHLETNVITFLTCRTNTIWNQSLTDIHLETNVIPFLKTLKMLQSLNYKKALFRYSEKIYIVSLISEMVQYHFTIENIIFIHV